MWPFNIKSRKLFVQCYCSIFKHCALALSRNDARSSFRLETARIEFESIAKRLYVASPGGPSFSGVVCHGRLGNIFRLSFSSQYVSFIAYRKVERLSIESSVADCSVDVGFPTLRYVL